MAKLMSLRQRAGTRILRY